MARDPASARWTCCATKRPTSLGGGAISRWAAEVPPFAGADRRRAALFRLSRPPSCRDAVPVAMTGLAHHAYGQAVAHRRFDLATRNADVGQHTIVEPVELAHSAAQPSLSG